MGHLRDGAHVVSVLLLLLLYNELDSNRVVVVQSCNALRCAKRGDGGRAKGVDGTSRTYEVTPMGSIPQSPLIEL